MKDWHNLSEQLRKMGVKFGVKNEPFQKVTPYPLEAVITCEEEITRSGSVLTTKKEMPLSYAQTKYNINVIPRLTSLFKWAGIPKEQNILLENIVFLDIETTGLSGGTGTLAFLTGVGKFKDDSFQLKQFFLRNPSEEEAFLIALAQFCADIKVVVTYNGKSFDIPILNNRHVLNRMPSPFIDIHHIDLLTISRQLWKLRLEQCRLADIEDKILNFKRESEEIPGYLAPEFYKDYLKTGDARPLKGVFYHNQEDVLSLFALFTRITNILENSLEENLTHSEDTFSLARVLEKMDDQRTVHELYKKGDLLQVNQNLKIRFLLQQARFYKQLNEYDKAVPLWNEAVNLQSIMAMEELAKFHEHKSKKLNLALELTNLALNVIKNQECMDTYHLNRFEQRYNRIIKKIQRKHQLK